MLLANQSLMVVSYHLGEISSGIVMENTVGFEFSCCRPRPCMPATRIARIDRHLLTGLQCLSACCCLIGLLRRLEGLQEPCKNLVTDGKPLARADGPTIATGYNALSYAGRLPDVSKAMAEERRE